MGADGDGPTRGDYDQMAHVILVITDVDPRDGDTKKGQGIKCETTAYTKNRKESVEGSKRQPGVWNCSRKERSKDGEEEGKRNDQKQGKLFKAGKGS